MGDDADPDYKLFLEHLRVDGKSYVLEMICEDSRSHLRIKYEDDEDSSDIIQSHRSGDGSANGPSSCPSEKKTTTTTTTTKRTRAGSGSNSSEIAACCPEPPISLMFGSRWSTIAIGFSWITSGLWMGKWSLNWITMWLLGMKRRRRRRKKKKKKKKKRRGEE
uniref:Uncharacterized protein n=1 Tax=Ananas comosus var. bracteatus TaxID=296719 RepID=A0A6V7QNX7_ANACO|nr:unnamed protein product [Ananas comosus var. bracteatus]